MTTEKKVLLSEATGPQMRAFAETHLGMSFKFNEANEKVRAKIAEAWGKDEIVVQEEGQKEPQTGSPPNPVTEAQQPPGPNKVKIIIQRTEEPGGDEPVPVGVNGKIMLVPRGEEVEIPYAYYDVLKNSIKHIYESYPEGGLNPVPRKVSAFPFQRVA